MRTRWPSEAACGIVLDAASFPALPGALAVARRGLRTGGDLRNREFVAGATRARRASPRSSARSASTRRRPAGSSSRFRPTKGAVLEAAFADAGLSLARIGQVVEGAGVALA